jgi:TPR repeat protein
MTNSRTAIILPLILAATLAWTQTDIAHLKERAERGDVSAELTLAQAYFMGNGVPKDQTEAAHWFRQAAEQGEPQSQRILGLMYQAGAAGLPRDNVQAASWFLKAAEHGDALAQNQLGGMYEAGNGGLAKDATQARIWYRKAADQGIASAQNQLGEMYENGRGGLVKDDTEAIAWYLKAADQSSAAGLNNAARLYITSSNARVRDPRMGLEYARKAVAADGKNPLYLSTLAQGYSVEGEFAEAVETQQKALALASPFNKADYAGRLKEYELALEQSRQEPAPRQRTNWPH